MKLLIDIPKEFEQHFQMDRFEDSMIRLSADAHLLAGLYEQETILMLIEAFKKAVLVPPHGRLGDLDRLEAQWANCDHGAYYDKMNFVRSIQKAPTIIPAEENNYND